MCFLFSCLLHSEGIALCRGERHPEVDMTTLLPGQELQNQCVMLCFLDIELVLLKHAMLICLNIDNTLGEVLLLPFPYLNGPIDLFVVIL